MSVLAVLRVGALAAGELSAGQGYALLGLWSAALVLYLIAMADEGLPPGKALREMLPQGMGGSSWRWEAGAILLVTAVGAVARLAALGRIPLVLGGDEASMGLDALAVLQGRLTSPFVTGWLSHSTLFFYALSVGMRCLGVTVAGLRIVPALAGTLTVPALYLLARELYSQRVALIAALFLAAYHFAVHYSRLSYNNIVDPLLATLAAYLLFVGLRTRRRVVFALAGVVLGLGQYFYMGSRVVPLVLVAFLAWRCLREPGFWRDQRGGLAILAAGFLLTGWPLFVFFAQHPQDYMARVGQLGIIQSGWLARAAVELQRSQASLLWEQFAKSVLAFHVFPDPGAHYAPGIPLLDGGSAILFTFGLVYSAAHFGERRHALPVLWLSGVLIFGSMLLENPPSSQRLVLAIVPVSLFVALGLTQVVDVGERAFAVPRITMLEVTAMAAIALAAVNLYFYFGIYTPSHAHDNTNTVVGQEMGLYLRSLGPGYRYYFLGAPRMYAGFPNTTYLAPDVPGQDIEQPLTEPPLLATDGERPVFLFLPERLGELAFVRQAYPEGSTSEFRQASGDLLFVAYEPSEVSNDGET